MTDDDYRKYGNSRAAQFVIEDPHKCFVCQAFVPDDALVCPKCGFPQNGDEASQRYFLGQLRVEKNEEKVAIFQVGHAFYLLGFLPVILFLLALDFWKNYNNMRAAEIAGLLGCLFLSLWIFGRKKPFLAFALSLGLYALITMPLFIYIPKVLLATRFWIIGPYIYLAFGMFAFRDYQYLDKELKGKNSG